MSLSLVVIMMLLIASAVGMVTQKLRIPYTVALVITGLILSYIRTRFYPQVDVGLHLTKELLFVALLPVLIYEAAFHLELKDFLANWKSILILAVPGLLLGILLSGGLFYGGFRAVGLPLTLGAALLVATILAATDPVGVISLLRATSAPRRLAVLMEGESLLNDGVAVVVFTVVLVALGLSTEQSQITPLWLVRFMSWEVFGALLWGGGLGYFLAGLTSKVDDHLIEITLSTIGAFGSFLLAEKIHSSGVIACLAAGMFAGNYGAKYGMSPTTRVAMVAFWEYAVFVANSIIFLLIGLDVNPLRLLRSGLAIGIVWLAMLVSRGLFVGLTVPLLSRWEGKMPSGFASVIAWGGVRGGIAMVLALSIPRHFEQRELVVNCIFGASLLTILIQSTTIGPLLKRLGLVQDRRAFELVEKLRGRLRALHAAFGYLDRQQTMGLVSSEAIQVLRPELEQEIQAIESEWSSSEIMMEQVRLVEISTLRRRLLMVRKESLRQATMDGAIDEQVMRQLVGEIDEKLHQLEELQHKIVEQDERDTPDQAR